MYTNATNRNKISDRLSTSFPTNVDVNRVSLALFKIYLKGLIILNDWKRKCKLEKKNTSDAHSKKEITTKIRQSEQVTPTLNTI